MNRRRQRGAVLMWSMLIVLVLIGFVGLALDAGHMVLAGQQLQNVADASALAAARVARQGIFSARYAAVNIALNNEVNGDPLRLWWNLDNDADGDIVIGYYNRADRTFEATEFHPNAIKVTARRTAGSRDGKLPLTFGPAFGVDSVSVERYAIAIIGSTQPAPGIIALNRTAECALTIGGNSNPTIEGGDIQINSSHDRAFCINGNPTIIANKIDVGGGAKLVGSWTFVKSLETMEPGQLNEYTYNWIPDPLEYLNDFPPPLGEDRGTVSISGNPDLVELQPGHYPGGISANNGNIRLLPGIYVLDGAGLVITGSTDMCAKGVVFYVRSGEVKLTGTGVIEVDPMPSAFSDPLYDCTGLEVVTAYEHRIYADAQVSIWQADTNTTEATFIGTSNMDLKGILYFPSAHVDATGTSNSLGNQLIADTIYFGGNGELTIDYLGQQHAGVPKVYLVE